MTRPELSTAPWQRTRKAFVAQWVARHGRLSAGWRRPPHPAWPLEVDHIEPRSFARGLQCLCGPCNAAKGDWRPKPKPKSRAEIHQERSQRG